MMAATAFTWGEVTVYEPIPIQRTGPKSNHCGSLIESVLSLARGYMVRLPSRKIHILSLLYNEYIKTLQSQFTFNK